MCVEGLFPADLECRNDVNSSCEKDRDKSKNKLGLHTVENREQEKAGRTNPLTSLPPFSPISVSVSLSLYLWVNIVEKI